MSEEAEKAPRLLAGIAASKQKITTPKPKVSKQAKPISLFNIWMIRMEESGRTEEYERRMLEIKQETGKKHSQAMWACMKEFGYTTAKEAQGWYADFKERITLEKLEVQSRQRKAEAVRKTVARKKLNAIEDQFQEKLQTFDEAIAQLPVKADDYEEAKWIASHPAISRLALSSDKTRVIQVSVEDVTNPMNGPAPSQTAVRSLINSVNHPAIIQKLSTEFIFKNAMKRVDESSSGGNGDDGSNWDYLDDLTELRGLIKETRERMEGPESTKL